MISTCIWITRRVRFASAVDNLCGPGVNDALVLRSEILGISRLMGAGRTEPMKVLYGAMPRTSGYVTLDGHEVVRRVLRRTDWPMARLSWYIRKRDGLSARHVS